MVCPRTRMGERLLWTSTPHSRAATSSSPLPQGRKGRGHNRGNRIRGPSCHDFEQPTSFPRRMSASGVLRLCFTNPESRGGRSAERRSGACEAPGGRIMTQYARRLARCLASRNAGRSPLGAPPWRFWASGPRFRLLRRPPPCNGGHLPSRSVQRAPPRRATSRASRGEQLRAAAAGRHASLRLWIASRRRPSMSEAGKLSSTATLRSH